MICTYIGCSVVIGECDPGKSLLGSPRERGCLVPHRPKLPVELVEVWFTDWVAIGEARPKIIQPSMLRNNPNYIAVVRLIYFDTE